MLFGICVSKDGFQIFVSLDLSAVSKGQYIGPYDRSGKTIRCFLWHLPGSGRQLPEMDIEIRFIVQVCIIITL